jgi:hypothetical protein
LEGIVGVAFCDISAGWHTNQKKARRLPNGFQYDLHGHLDPDHEASREMRRLAEIEDEWMMTITLEKRPGNMQAGSLPRTICLTMSVPIRDQLVSSPAEKVHKKCTADFVKKVRNCGLSVSPKSRQLTTFDTGGDRLQL